VRIQRFVKRYTRVILFAIVVLMALPLALTYGPWMPGAEQPEQAAWTLTTGETLSAFEWARAGNWRTLFHELCVTHQEEELLEYRTMSHDLDYRYLIESLRAVDENPVFKPFIEAQLKGLTIDDLRKIRARFGRPAPQEHLDQDARSLMLLLHRAEAMGIRTEESEIDRWIREPRQPWFEFDESGQRLFSQALFDQYLQRHQLSPEGLRAFARDLLSAEKYLRLMTDHAEKPLKDAAVRTQERRARIVYTLFDPTQLRETVHVTAAAVQKYYEENKAAFTSRPRVAFDYLLADFETFGALSAAPSEEQLRAYYEAHARDFVPPPSPDRSVEPEDDPKPRPFEEVRDQIRKILLREAGRPRALQAFETVYREIAAALARESDPVKKAEIGAGLDLYIRAERARAAGAPIEYGVTPMVADTLEDAALVESKIGKLDPGEPRDLEWASFFLDERRKHPLGEMPPVPVTTDRGLVLYRLRRTADPHPLPLDDAQGRKIRAQLEQEERERRTSKIAEAFAGRIDTAGLAAALSWSREQGFDAHAGHSLYFGPTPPPTHPDLKEPLQRALRQLLPPSPQREAPPRWVVVPTKLESTSRVLCVYLEDVVNLPAGDFVEALKTAQEAERDQARAAARLRFQDEMRKKLVPKGAGS
jgi:hypothetical protein